MNPPRRPHSSRRPAGLPRLSAATRTAQLEAEYDRNLMDGIGEYHSAVTGRDTATSADDRARLQQLLRQPAQFQTYYQRGDDANTPGEVYRCTEEGCADWAYNYQVARYSGNTPTTSPQAFAEAQQRIKRQTGMMGNAWQGIGNIVSAGGELLYNRFDPSGTEVGVRTPKLQPGDMVGLYDPMWSSTGKHAEAIKKEGKLGARNSHIGVVARVDADGTPWVKHNFGTSVRMDPLRQNAEGYYDLDSPGVTFSYSVSSAARPRTLAPTPQEAVRQMRTDKRVASLNGNQLAPRGQYVNNPMVQNAVRALNLNKVDLIRKLGISQQEFEDYSRIALGVLGQESGYDQANGIRDRRAFRAGKEAVKSLISMFGDGVASKGPAQIKYLPKAAADFNIALGDLSELNVAISPEERAGKSALAAFLLAAEHGQALKAHPERQRSGDINYQIAKMHQTPNAHRSPNRSANLATYEDAYAGQVLQNAAQVVDVVDEHNRPVASTFGSPYYASRELRLPPPTAFNPRDVLLTMAANTTAVRPAVRPRVRARFGKGGNLPDCGCHKKFGLGGMLDKLGNYAHDYGLGVADTAMGLVGMTDVIDRSAYRTGAGKGLNDIFKVTTPIAGQVLGASVGIPPQVTAGLQAAGSGVNGSVQGQRDAREAQRQQQMLQEQAYQQGIGQLPMLSSTPGFYALGGTVPGSYEVEGGEVIQGQPMVESGHPLASDLLQVTGATHAQGGVQGVGGERVFSDRLKPKGEQKTFAELAAAIGKRKRKVERAVAEGGRYAQASAERMLPRLDAQLDQLFMTQEMQKTPKRSAVAVPTFAGGGTPPRLVGYGGMDWEENPVITSAAYPPFATQGRMPVQVPGVNADVYTGPVVAPTTSPVNAGMRVPSSLPLMNTAPTTPSSGFDWRSAAESFAPFIDNAVASLMPMPRVAAPTLLTAPRLQTRVDVGDALAQVNQARRDTTRSFDSANNSGVARANRIAGMTESQRAVGNLLTQKGNQERQLLNQQELSNADTRMRNQQILSTYQQMVRENQLASQSRKMGNVTNATAEINQQLLDRRRRQAEMMRLQVMAAQFRRSNALDYANVYDILGVPPYEQ